MSDSQLQTLFLHQFVKNMIQEMPLKQNPEPHIAIETPESADYERVEPLKIKTIKEITGTVLTSNTLNVPAQSKEGPWAKIDALLKDNLVQAIECPGPEKQLIIHKNNSLTTMPLSFNAEEIKTILENIAQQTQTPFMQGIIKAQTPNYTLTGIVSEFAGSRFIVYKKQVTSGVKTI